MNMAPRSSSMSAVRTLQLLTGMKPQDVLRDNSTTVRQSPWYPSSELVSELVSTSFVQLSCFSSRVFSTTRSSERSTTIDVTHLHLAQEKVLFITLPSFQFFILLFDFFFLHFVFFSYYFLLFTSLLVFFDFFALSFFATFFVFLILFFFVFFSLFLLFTF